MLLNRCVRLTSGFPCQNLPAITQIISGHHHSGRSNLTLVRFSSNEPSKGAELVYEGPLTSKIKAVKIFSLTTSLTGLAAQPIIIEQASKLGGTPVVVLLSGFVGFFTFVTPLLLHWITKKYVTMLQYNAGNKEYSATTISFFLTHSQTKFKIPDVKVPEVPGLFTTFQVGKKALFVDPREFRDPNHFVKIMGFDKPIDFKFDLVENPKDHSIDKDKKEKS
ncbi:Transmembrane protein 70 homolog, mitochondrial [Sergentomyia squamirostris]